jgi:hypothetical protein
MSMSTDGSPSWKRKTLIKSVIVTGMKNGVRFINYGTEVVRAKLRGERLPLRLAGAMDTSSSLRMMNRSRHGRPAHPTSPFPHRSAANLRRLRHACAPEFA